MKNDFNIKGMTCSACSSHIEKAVGKLQGVDKVEVSLLMNHMVVDYDKEQVTAYQITQAVKKVGYEAIPIQEGKTQKREHKGEDPSKEEQKQMKHRLIWSFVFLIPLMYIAMGHMVGLPLPSFFHGTPNALLFSFTQLLLTLPIIYCNRKYFKMGGKALWHRAPNMDSLIAIGAFAAVLYGIFAIYQIGYGLGHMDPERVYHYSMSLYFESAAMILTLVTLGKYLETRSKGKTSEAIQKLLDLSPKMATVIEKERTKQVSIEEVKLGDMILVRPGETVPVDGIVEEGESHIDESSMTGESLPVRKQKNSKVMAATVNQLGTLQIKAEKVGKDTTISQMITLVEQASASKAPIGKLADKISHVFVPIVIAIAITTMGIWLVFGASFEFALSIAISVLVISCPCALGLATPVSIMVGTGKAAQCGILIKTAESLEKAHEIDTIVLDKTGTITEGKPKVTDFVTRKEQEKEVKVILASLEVQSEHPLAKAMVAFAGQEVVLKKVEGFETSLGQGIKGKIEGSWYYIGNDKLMKENQVQVGIWRKEYEEKQEQGKTTMYLAKGKEVIGVVAVSDEVKQTSVIAIKQWHHRNKETVLLTGDHQKIADYIGKQIGIDTVMAEVLPQQKEEVIRKLQQAGKKVAMIGDGINDSPALARADIGIAIGAGTDIAIESADMILIRNDLLDAVTAFDLSKATIRNIKMNLFWAFFYNIIGIPLAAGILYPMFGITLNPMIASLAMSISSVCVVTNALRLRAFQPKWKIEKMEEDKTEKENKKKKEEEKKGMEMEKTIIIEGMSCNHCKMAVEKALLEIEGVKSAQVNLEEKSATILLEKPVEDHVLETVIAQLGYEVKKN